MYCYIQAKFPLTTPPDPNTFGIHTNHYHLHEDNSCCCQSRINHHTNGSTYFQHKHRFLVRIIDFGKLWGVS